MSKRKVDKKDNAKLQTKLRLAGGIYDELDCEELEHWLDEGYITNKRKTLYISREEAIKACFYEGSLFIDTLALLPRIDTYTNTFIEYELERVLNGKKHVVIAEPCAINGVLCRYGIALGIFNFNMSDEVVTSKTGMLDLNTHFLSLARKMSGLFGNDKTNWVGFYLDENGYLIMADRPKRPLINTKQYKAREKFVSTIQDATSHTETILKARAALDDYRDKLTKLMAVRHITSTAAFKMMATEERAGSDQYNELVAAYCEVVRPTFYSKQADKIICDLDPRFYGVALIDGDPLLNTLTVSGYVATYPLETLEITVQGIKSEHFLSSGYIPIEKSVIDALSINGNGIEGEEPVLQSAVAGLIRSCLDNLA